MPATMRVRVTIRDVGPQTDVSMIARQIAEVVRNMTAGEVNVRIRDNTPVQRSKR